MSIRNRQPILITCAAAIVIFLFLLFRHLPLQRELWSLNRIRTVKTSAITRAQNQKKQIPVLNKTLRQLRDRTEKYELQIPPKRELGTFLHKITVLMNVNNLRDQQVLPGSEVAISGEEVDVKKRILCAIPLNMVSKGSLSQIFEFYESLLELDRFIRIEQVELENDRNFSGIVTMQTKAVVYYRSAAG